jgi:hypothetical protein
VRRIAGDKSLRCRGGCFTKPSDTVSVNCQPAPDIWEQGVPVPRHFFLSFLSFSPPCCSNLFIMRYVSTLLCLSLLAHFSLALSLTTNAKRMAQGLPPMYPKNLYKASRSDSKSFSPSFHSELIHRFARCATHSKLTRPFDISEIHKALCSVH